MELELRALFQVAVVAEIHLGPAAAAVGSKNLAGTLPVKQKLLHDYIKYNFRLISLYLVERASIWGCLLLRKSQRNLQS